MNEERSLADEWQIITAGYFATEDWVNGPKWEEQVKMYSKIISSLPHLSITPAERN
jgi:hypothetical protein